MPFPIFLLGGLSILTAISYLLRDWQRECAMLSAAALAALGISLWITDLEPSPETSNALLAPLERLGFVFQLELSTQPVLVTALLLTALALVCTAILPQERNFVPSVLGLLAGYCLFFLLASAPLAPALFAPIMFAVLSAASVGLLQASRPTYAGGPLRMLIPPVLAAPIAFIVAWYLEQAPLNPQADVVTLFATPLAALMFVLLSAPVPLHSAQPVSAQTAPPLASALTTLLYQLALIHLLHSLTRSFPFIREEGTLSQLLALAGLLTALWGGLAAAGTNHCGRLWGYSALHDWGLILLVMATPGLKSLSLALFLFGLRTVSMMTAATGLAALEQSAGSLNERNLRGAGSRLPWSSAAFLLGGLGLVGFPLSAGFTGHWAALQLIADSDWRVAVAILVSSAGAIIGYIRIARVLFGPLEDRYLFREKTASAILAALVLILSISLAIVPQLLDGPINQAAVVLGS